jgi:hypothetical protein
MSTASGGLSEAVARRAIGEVEKLIAGGVDVNALDSDGWTVLTRAVTVEVLLQYGADELLEGRWWNGLIKAARASGSLAIQRIIGSERHL